MENAVDALKIAFAVIVFVIAISIAFAVFSQARAVSDILLYANDKTNFEEYVLEHAKINRTVGIETIIPTIRRYLTNNDVYSVEVIDGSKTYVFDLVNDQQTNLTPDKLKENLEKNLEELIRKYSDSTFIETYSEKIYRGDISTSENGETIEKVNTDTNVKVTYTKI